MTAVSDWGEDYIIDELFTLTNSKTRPTAWYVGLKTTATTDADGGTELSGDGYSRQSVTFDAAAAGASQNSGAFSFVAAGGDWGDVTHCGIYDAPTGGNLLWHGPLDATRTMNDGDTLTWAIGDLDVSIN